MCSLAISLSRQIRVSQPGRCNRRTSCRVSSRLWIDKPDEHARLLRVAVAVVELGDVARPEQRAEAPEAARAAPESSPPGSPRAARPARRARPRSAGGRSSCWRRRRSPPACCPRTRRRSTQALAPATASAPAGSRIERVSSNTSLMAAQMSSLSTRTISSTSSRHRRKVSSPDLLHRHAVGEQPDLGAACTRWPAASERVMASAVYRLHADDLDLRAQALDVGGDARDQSAAAHGDEDGVDRAAVLAQDLHADGALAGDHVRVVVGVDEGEPFARGRASGWA